MIKRFIISLARNKKSQLIGRCGELSTLTCLNKTSLLKKQLSEAFKSLHAFPDTLLITKFISQFSYSSDSYCLNKCFHLILLIHKQNPHSLSYDFLAKSALSFARANMTTQTCTLLRIMLQLRKFPPMDLWRTAFLYLGKTQIGTYLASDLLVDICDCFVRRVGGHGEKNVKHLKLITPDTILFNLVLDACVRFRSILRAEQLVELMALTGVVADATTIVLIAQIHEMNGQRDELKKFKDYVDRVPRPLHRHYRQFYDSLLSLHFKFEDIDSAAELVLDMYKHQGSFITSRGVNPNESKSSLIKIGSHNLKTGLALQIKPDFLNRDFVLSVANTPELVTYIGGRLIPNDKALAKVIYAYRRHGKVGELLKLLISIQNESDILGKAGLSSDVLGACIQIRWLEMSHDILDDMEAAGIPMEFESYLTLLTAYCKENMLKEAMVLMKQMRKRGWLQDISDKDVISKCFSEKGFIITGDKKYAKLVENSRLAEFLIREMEEKEPVPRIVYEINSSIYFFCKGNMMEDALRTFKRMQEKKIQPTLQTFAYLINGLSKLRMYREITILWGELKRKLNSGDLTANRDLYEMLLWNFIRGGYFERVMEVIEYMKKNEMYTDKWKYKGEFLKFHENLYRSLKAEKTKTEAQRKRLEHVRAFRKWTGID